MGRIAYIGDPGYEYQKCIIVEADSEAEAMALVTEETAKMGWSIIQSKEIPIGKHHFLCGHSGTTKPYPAGF